LVLEKHITTETYKQLQLPQMILYALLIATASVPLSPSSPFGPVGPRSPTAPSSPGEPGGPKSPFSPISPGDMTGNGGGNKRIVEMGWKRRQPYSYSY